MLQASTHVNFDKTDIRTADNEKMHHIAWLEIDRSYLLACCLLFTVILKEMYITISTFYNVLTLVTFASIRHNSSCKFQEVTLYRAGICYEDFWSFWWGTIANNQQTKSLHNNYRYDISYHVKQKYRRGNDWVDKVCKVVAQSVAGKHCYETSCDKMCYEIVIWGI